MALIEPSLEEKSFLSLLFNNNMKTLIFPLLFLLFCLCSCSTIEAEADPTTGHITKLYYRGFIREYQASLVQRPDGSREIYIGAKGEIDRFMEFAKLLGAGGIGALAGGAIPALTSR